MSINWDKDRNYIILGAISLLVVIGLGGYSGYLNYTTAKDERMCLVNSDNLYVLDILFDTTDISSENQKRVVKERITEKLNDINEGSLVRIYSISAEIGGLSNVEFEMCKPRTVAQTSDLTGNKVFAKRNKAPLDTIVNNMLNSKPQVKSPIIEALHDYSKKIHPVSTNKEIIIISDLLQNTKDYSIYNETKRLTTYPYMVDLKKADVQIYVMERKGNMRKRQNRLFIEDWSKMIGKNVENLKFDKVRS